MSYKQSLENYLEEEIGKNAIKKISFPKIIKDVYEKTGLSYLYRTRGDGSCLIRSILKYYKEHLPNILNEIIINLFELGERDIILPNELENDVYEDVICQIIIDLIKIKWDYNGTSDYHMNNNSIDGLAISMSMRLLGVSKLNIYQAYEGGGRSMGWRTFEVKNSFQEAYSFTIPIFTLNGVHYNSLI